jgi:hypothetical protein
MGAHGDLAQDAARCNARKLTGKRHHLQTSKRSGMMMLTKIVSVLLSSLVMRKQQDLRCYQCPQIKSVAQHRTAYFNIRRPVPSEQLVEPGKLTGMARTHVLPTGAKSVLSSGFMSWVSKVATQQVAIRKMM